MKPLCLLAACSLLIGAAGAAQTKRFGRFGFAQGPQAPGLEWAGSAVRAAVDGASWIRWGESEKSLRPVLASEWGATFLREPEPASPTKVRANLLAPGLELYFPGAMSLRLETEQCPYLSWSAGSVGPEVPTAPSKWTLITFRDRQPPILISFLGGESSVVVSGSPGQWVVRATNPMVGWVRLCLPNGLAPASGSGVADLGRQVGHIASQEGFWTQPAPVCTSFSASRAPGGIVATWRFDRPGALVPPVIAKARAAGFAIEVRSRSESLGVQDREGKLVRCLAPILSVFFPATAPMQGRALTWADRPIRARTPLSPFDAPSVFEVAAANLFAARDTQCFQLADGALADFLVGAPQTVEPVTRVALPFMLEPGALDLAAAQALLMQSLQNAAFDGSPNAILDSILAAMDAWSWRIAAPIPSSSFAGSVSALAAWLHPDPQAQAFGAMLYAGMVAEGVASGTLRGVLASAFSSRPTDPFVVALTSPVRIASSHCVLAAPAPLGWFLEWTDGQQASEEIQIRGVQLGGATPNGGLSRVLAKNSPGRAALSYRGLGAGPFRAVVRPVARETRLPPMPPLPKLMPDRK